MKAKQYNAARLSVLLMSVLLCASLFAQQTAERRTSSSAQSASVSAQSASVSAQSTSVGAQSTPVSALSTPVSQMEPLTRGVVAVPAAGGGIFVSWRLLGTDPLTTTFDLLRDGVAIAKNLGSKTNYADAAGTATSKYSVVVKVDGREVETTDPVTPWASSYLNIKLDRPASGTARWRDWDASARAYSDWQDAAPYSYMPYECSVGDVDGDGIYELFVKWQPSNAQDNSLYCGPTGNTYIDCYRLDGTKLWRVDLGVNIRAGAHYTQFMVFDFNGDGRAELICKTAPGSKDSRGTYVSQAADETAIRQVDDARDWRSEYGKIIGGQEYLTVFDGLTGQAVHTVFYNPNRNAEYYTPAGYNGYSYAADGTYNWDDRAGKTDYASYGNRGERYLACVAYLDGPDKNPSAVMCRGYYTNSYLWAVDFDGKKLSTKWLHASVSKTKVEHVAADGTKSQRTYSSNTFGVHDVYTAYGQGNHQLSVADVDGDGCDEIIYGAATIDHDGHLLYSTGLGHGDALHVADLLPDRPGLEVFRCLEESPYGCEMHDAATGEKLYYRTADGDTGRCMAADIDSNHRGYEFWASDASDVCNAQGEVVSTSRPSYSFRIYWDGDPDDELYNKGAIDKWNGNGVQRLFIGGKNIYQINSSQTADKDGSSLQADLFGDWREEIVCWSATDSASLNIFTTNVPSNYRVPTLMHDHVYRMGVAWQNVAYNQPPHLGYYLPDADFSSPEGAVDENAPDLSGYELKREFDFGSMDDTYITTTYPNDAKGTAWETGNRKQQKLYNTQTPADWHDWLAFQGTYSGYGTKGWWVNHTLGGLQCADAARSAAVLGLEKGDIVIIEATNNVDGTLTVTNGSDQPDGPFTFAKSDDGSKYYCTMTANGQLGFCGLRYPSGAIKSIKIYRERDFVLGDANGDGAVDVFDIVALANAIMGNASATFNKAAADMNGDGSADVFDIVALANAILAASR